MKNLAILLLSLTIASVTSAQLCPGGGTNFSNAVLFNPAWIAGCTSGTTCTGGTDFDNRAACEPTTAMEACAVNPSCGIFANMGSDLWYRFYANATTATITINQNVSFVASIQAFQGGPLCSALAQTGCIIAGGPSGGVTLNLSGLTINNLYYFRIFGTANSASQRTGTFCFCGSAGMSNILLPVKLISFNAAAVNNAVKLNWVTSTQININRFEIEKSGDGNSFTFIASKFADNAAVNEHHYVYEDFVVSPGNNFYRLKMIDNNGSFEYSPIVKINAKNSYTFSAAMDNTNHQLHISSAENNTAYVYNVQGEKISSFTVKKGSNVIACSLLSGMYVVRLGGTTEAKQIAVINQ